MYDTRSMMYDAGFRVQGLEVPPFAFQATEGRQGSGVQGCLVKVNKKSNPER
jgi:hypothetical protein